MKKYKESYKIETTRASWWNYGWNAAYFVTVCTKSKEHYFGEIKGGEVYLSKIGEIVKSEWLKTPDIRPDMNLDLGEFVVMPNHFHAIMIIGKNKYNTIDGMHGFAGRDAMHCVSTGNLNLMGKNNSFKPQSKNLGAIMRGFKASVSREARLINPIFAWQARFHDKIIRDKDTFRNISNYIINNPLKW